MSESLEKNKSSFQLLSLPPELIIEISLTLSLSDLNRLCQSHSYLNKVLCTNQIYWQLRYIQDLGYTRRKITDWKHAYKIAGDVWVCGGNMCGQLGLGDTNNRDITTKIPNMKAKSVSCGNNHTILIDFKDNVWVCGGNECGQLGRGHTKSRDIPNQIPNMKIKSVACGHQHTAIIDLQDNVWVFGGNGCGQLGLGDTTNRYAPIQIPNMRAKLVICGPYHTVIIT